MFAAPWISLCCACMKASTKSSNETIIYSVSSMSLRSRCSATWSLEGYVEPSMWCEWYVSTKARNPSRDTAALLGREVCIRVALYDRVEVLGNDRFDPARCRRTHSNSATAAAAAALSDSV